MTRQQQQTVQEIIAISMSAQAPLCVSIDLNSRDQALYIHVSRGTQDYIYAPYFYFDRPEYTKTTLEEIKSKLTELVNNQ